MKKSTHIAEKGGLKYLKLLRKEKKKNGNWAHTVLVKALTKDEACPECGYQKDEYLEAVKQDISTLKMKLDWAEEREILMEDLVALKGFCVSESESNLGLMKKVAELKEELRKYQQKSEKPEKEVGV